MKILLLFLISFSSFAGYMSKADLESCTGARTSFTRHSDCERTKGVKCYKVSDKHKCQYHRVKTTKSELSICSDNTECQSLLLALSLKGCDDPKEKAIKVLDTDPKEVYCTKTATMENASLKASYDASEITKQQTKEATKNKGIAVKDLLIKLDENTDLTDAELRQVLKVLIRRMRN